MEYDVYYSAERKNFDHKKVAGKLKDIFGEENYSSKEIDLFAYGKDYTLVSNNWLLEGIMIAKPDFIVWPENSQQISELCKLANKEEVPLIPFGEGSGVVGGALPIFGGIIIDMKKMSQIIEINEKNLTATIETGMNGHLIERELNQAGFTLGHVPQSVQCSTLGGYLAHKAAGQFSTKYGKIEDMILGYEAVLPTGEIITVKSYPKNSTGPQLDKFLIGSEGTLAIITKATLRIWPKPETQALISYAFSSMEDALNAVREILQQHIFPAVIRIYDKEETKRHFPIIKVAKNHLMTIFVCEGNSNLVETEKQIVNRFSEKYSGVFCGEEPVKHWFETRFDITETSKYTPLGLIMDTIEVAVLWDHAPDLYHEVIESIKNVEGTVISSGHASHFYPQGVCFYFSFGGTPMKKTEEEYWKEVWSACMEATLKSSGSISHHHGIGLNRTEWMDEEWQKLYPVLIRLKKTLDPKNILNPGKLYKIKKEE